jgi:glycosyltransferase involved in cell wall biosynthesis
MKIAILCGDSNGCYPVPASRGGAVSILVEHIVSEHNQQKCFELTVFSFYDNEAVALSNQYPNVKFEWIKIPVFIKGLDFCIFKLVRFVFKEKKDTSFKSVASLLFYILKASIIVSRYMFDKIVIENNIMLSWVLRFSNFKGEYYYHLHNTPRTNAKNKSTFERCTAFLCVSRYIATQISSDRSPIGPVNPSKLKILYNCVDSKQFSPVKDSDNERDFYRNKYHLKIDDKVIIFVGRLSSEKGIDVLLQSIKYVTTDNIKVLIVGSYIHGDNICSDYEYKIKKMADELGDIVQFTGYIEQQELPKLYRSSDIAVLPSMWDEPAGLTMVEAMACELPVITTNSGGIPEYVADSGIIIERDGNIYVNIANAIDDLLCASLSNIAGLLRVQKYFIPSIYYCSFIEKVTLASK